MTTRQYLNQLRNIDKEIRDNQLLAMRYRENALPTSPQLTDMKVQTSHITDKMAESIVKAIDYEDKAEQEAVQLIELKHHIEEQIKGIKKLDDRYAKTYYNILMGRYIRKMSDAALCKYVGYGAKQLRRRIEKAYDLFESLYGAEYLDLTITPNNEQDAQ